MPNILTTQYHDLGTGVVATIALQGGMNGMLIYGTSAGATSVVTSGTVADDMDFVIYWNGDAGNNACTVLGTAMPTGMITLTHFIVCHYNSVTAAWNVRFLPNAATAFLVNAMVSATAAIARTKIANGTASYVLVNTAGGVMSEEQFLNQVRGGFGLSVAGFTGVLKAVAGAFTAASVVNADISAVAAIALTKLAASTFNRAAAFGAAGFLEASVTTLTELSYLSGATSNIQTQIAGLVGITSYKITVSSAEILLLNGTPKSLVAAQGAGTIIVPVGNPVFSMDYNTLTYTTNLNLEIYHLTCASNLFLGTNFLAQTAGYSKQFAAVTATGATDDQYETNQALMLRVASGNPLVGNSTITIRGLYYVAT